MDEPELHLNPKLIRGLPQFYRKHLGESLQNQIWLVTHSDALLREVVGRDAYNVFHMLPYTQVKNKESQIKQLSATADLDLALADLIGDLAAYRPGGKVVIVEGEDSDFDQRVVSTLFPELSEQANLISGTNKARVQGLLQILDNATHKGYVPFKFYSITDRDSEFSSSNSKSAASLNSFSWNVYHIENYFLVPKYILKVLSALQITTSKSEDEIWDQLRECAKETLPKIVRHELSNYANTLLIESINIKTNPKLDKQSQEIFQSVQRSIERINSLFNKELTLKVLGEKEEEIRNRYLQNISDGTWVNTFHGRDILKKFVYKNSLSVQYEVFRNLILGQMKDDSYQPSGMKCIVDKILSG